MTTSTPYQVSLFETASSPTSLPADSLASHSAQQEPERAKTMTVTSGLRCSRLLRQSDPLGLLLKTLLASSRWHSTTCCLTWKAKATPRKRLLFQLVPRARRTDATEYGLLPTVALGTTPQAFDATDINRSPDALARAKEKGGCANLREVVKLLPTPTAEQAQHSGRTKIKDGQQNHLSAVAALLPTPTTREHKGARKPETLAATGRNPMTNTLGDAILHLLATPTVNGNYNRKGLSAKSGDGLATQVKMLATPQARDYRTGQAERFDNPARSRNLNDQVATEKSGKLSVTFVLWMQGFPPNWLEVD